MNLKKDALILVCITMFIVEICADSTSDSVSQFLGVSENVSFSGYGRSCQGDSRNESEHVLRDWKDTSNVIFHKLQMWSTTDLLKIFAQYTSTNNIESHIGMDMENVNDLSTCLNDTNRLATGFMSGEAWTITFVDAWGKPGPGLTTDWLNFVGNYDQCKDAEAPSSNTDRDYGFGGGYFILTVYTIYSFERIRIGLCLPDSCSELEIHKLVGKVMEKYIKDAIVESVECRNAETKMKAVTVMAIFSVSILGILVILGTSYDLWFVQRLKTLDENDVERSAFDSAEVRPEDYNFVEKNTSSTKTHCTTKLLVAFSLYTNGKKLLCVSKTSASFTSIHGLWYLSMCCILVGHTFNVGRVYALNRPNTNSWTYDFIVNVGCWVDTFFTISGLLVSYQTINTINKNGLKINWLRFYYHRYLRLTPPYMIAMILFLGLTQYLGEGPLWSKTQPIDNESCEKKFWKHFLYINNLFNATEPGQLTSCFGHTWYLANMQFYVVSPLLLIPFYYHRLASIITCLVSLLASWITTGVLSTINGWGDNASPLPSRYKNTDDYLVNYYSKPWFRIGPFIVGVLAGYFLTHLKGKRIRLNWQIVSFGWIVSTGSLVAGIYGTHGDISGEDPTSTEAAALFNAVARSVWGASICWIIIACDAGYGGPVNTFLSWSTFEVLEKLTYTMYIIHMNILTIFFENMVFPYFINITTYSILFIGLCTFVTFAALIFTLLFEMPFVELEKSFLSPKKQE